MLYQVLAMEKERDSEKPADKVCLLSIAPRVLRTPGAYVTNMNAAKGSAAFFAAPEGLGRLRAEEVYAPRWAGSESDESAGLKERMMAEALVPHEVPTAQIQGVYARTERDRADVRAFWPEVKVAVRPDRFAFN